MSRKPGDIDKFRLLQDVSARALKRLGLIIDKGADTDAIAASRLILDRSMPVPKQSTAAIAAAAAGGAAGAHLALMAAKAQARLTNIADSMQDVTPTSSVEFAPLERV